VEVNVGGKRMKSVAIFWQPEKRHTIGLLPLYNNVNKLQWTVIQIKFLEVIRIQNNPRRKRMICN
jgi:hypothetical protein